MTPVHEPPAPHAPAERWLQWATTAGITILVGMLAWIGAQLVEMRDDIRELRAVVPVQIQDLQRRVTDIEHRMNRELQP